MIRFLKPGLAKIVVALIFFAIASILWRTYVISRISDTFPWGFPFQFYLGWGPCPPGETCFESKPMLLILDLAVWYVVGAWIVERLRKKT